MATQSFNVEVEPREDSGKNSCRRIRASGKIPGNVYGLGRPPLMVAVNPKRIDEVLGRGRGINTVFTLTLAGQDRSREAMIKELQRDPVTELPLHVDFVRIDPTQMIHISVPVHLEGIPEGVKNEGGIIDFVHRVIHVECLPGEIPTQLSVDVSGLHINQHVAVKDLDVPAERIKLLDDAEQIIAVVVAPKVEEEPVAAEGEVEEGAEDAAEPKEGEAKEESAEKES